MLQVRDIFITNRINMRPTLSYIDPFFKPFACKKRSVLSHTHSWMHFARGFWEKSKNIINHPIRAPERERE